MIVFSPPIFGNGDIYFDEREVGMYPLQFERSIYSLLYDMRRIEKTDGHVVVTIFVQGRKVADHFVKDEMCGATVGGEMLFA